MSLWSLTLAAYLSEDFNEKVEALARAYLAMKTYKESTALNACVIANMCLPRTRDSLYRMAYPKFDRQLADLAGNVGLPSGDWRKLSSHSVIRLVMRSLDATVTGGKNNGII
jgi:hypothetical protein